MSSYLQLATQETALNLFQVNEYPEPLDPDYTIVHSIVLVYDCFKKDEILMRNEQIDHESPLAHAHMPPVLHRGGAGMITRPEKGCPKKKTRSYAR